MRYSVLALVFAALACAQDGVQLDGRLREAAWSKPKLDVELTQQSPSPGQPTRFKTRVRVVMLKDTLYFGFECVDPEPGRIAVHTMQRDGEFEGDDTVAVVLDTYGDKRTGFYFRVNTAGARADGLISNPEHPSLDWDGIWDARTARSESGWSAEIAIPVRTLTFSKGLEKWGLNLEREVVREKLVLRWASPTLDSFLYDLSRAGDLEGVGGLRQGSGWEFSPFAVGRVVRDFETANTSLQGQPGADVTWRITPQLAAVFTVNTDFAETEVDSRQLNITRFPLFFPEKRAFFLEGSNQFEFGLGLGQTFIPFFSRRVGLFEGNTIPINGGVKLNGRVGRWNVGVLDVQTRDSRWAPATNLFAGRFSYDVTNELRLGTIFTNGEPSGTRDNFLAGFDAVWRTSKFRGDRNLLIGGWSVLTRRDNQTGQRFGWGYKVDYPNDLWDCYNQIFEFGEGLNPALGFLPRPGTRQLATGCTFAPRPSRDGSLRWIRKYYFRNYYRRADNLRGFNESWSYETTPAEIRFDTGDQMLFTWRPQHEYLYEPFEIADGVTLPAGSYTFNRFKAEFESSPHRPVAVSNDTQFGGFYNGHLLQQENSIAWTSPKGRVRLGLQVEQNFGTLDQGSFVQRLWQFNLAYAFNPNLVLTSFTQYDNESSNFGMNNRLRWTIKPGNDFFVVWNRGWKRLYLSPREIPLIPENELIAVKLRWTFRP